MGPTWTRRSVRQVCLFVALALFVLTPAWLRGETTMSTMKPDRTLAALEVPASQPLVAVPPEPPGSSRRVTLVWYDIEALLPSGLDAVAGQVEAFFREARLALSWREGVLGVSARDSEGLEVPVVLLGADPAPGRRRALGATRDGGPAPRPLWIFLDPLWRTLGEKARRGAFSATDMERLARPLARVIAHELVHSLAPGHGHALSGLMRHSFTRSELLREASPVDLDLVRGWLESAEIVSELGRQPGPAHN
jgi:hypothetical protein